MKAYRGSTLPPTFTVRPGPAAIQAFLSKQGIPRKASQRTNGWLPTWRCRASCVSALDLIGQGEREQTYDRQLDGEVAGWNTNEHIQAGAQSLLINQGLGRYFIWDAKRALDYLASRADVDADRLGAVGCSGGG